MTNPDALLAAAERIASRLAGRGIHAVLIGASALAAHRYVRHTEDIDLGVNVAICDLGSVAEGLREAGYEVSVREPDGQDPLGGVIDISGPFGLVQIVNFGERFPAVIDSGHADRGAIRSLCRQYRLRGLEPLIREADAIECDSRKIRDVSRFIDLPHADSGSQSARRGFDTTNSTHSPYAVSAKSFVSRRSGSVFAWATSIRSKGSACTRGSRATAAACSPVTGNILNPAGSISASSSAGSAASLPSAALMLTSQIEAALTKTSATSIRLRAAGGNLRGSATAQSNRCVSSRILLTTAPRTLRARERRAAR
jgi:hypothetical protein